MEILLHQVIYIKTSGSFNLMSFIAPLRLIIAQIPPSEIVSGETIMGPVEVILKDAYNQTVVENGTQVFVRIGNQNMGIYLYFYIFFILTNFLSPS